MLLVAATQTAEDGGVFVGSTFFGTVVLRFSVPLLSRAAILNFNVNFF